MSRSNELQNTMRRAARHCGGSHATIAARDTTIRQFVEFTAAQNIQIADIRQIRTRHVVAFVKHARANASVRTMQNKTSHLREILRECGKGDMADSSELSNAALGITGGSRIGKKVPLTREAVDEIHRRARYAQYPGVGLALKLQRELGLRNAEVLRHGTPSELSRWIRSAEAGEKLLITLGTKGGRSRRARPLDYEVFIALLHEAVALAKAQGGFLVPGASLKSALRRYSNWMHRRGVTPHAARYAWAADRVDQELAKERDMKSAFRIVANELGHGSGRVRWVRSVYCRHRLAQDRSVPPGRPEGHRRGSRPLYDACETNEGVMTKQSIDPVGLRDMPRQELERAGLHATFRDGDPALARACVQEIERRNFEAHGTARPFTRDD